MSTSGIVTIIYNKKRKTTYCHCDAYPESLGEHLLKFFSNKDKVVKFKEVFPKIKVVNSEVIPAKTTLAKVGKLVKSAYPCGDIGSWYDVLREYQCDFNFFLTPREYYPMINGTKCCWEYKYTVNLDNNMITIRNGIHIIDTQELG